MADLRPLEVACDESGNDGENNLSGMSPVFSHASVTLSIDAAAELIDEVRVRTKSQGIELKSKTILGPRHQNTAEWLLRHPSIKGNASVHLTHKKYLMVSKFFDSTAEEVAFSLGHDIYETGEALSAANRLFFNSPLVYGDAWDWLLVAFQHFMRAKDAAAAQRHLATMRKITEGLLEYENAPEFSVLFVINEGLTHLSSLSALQLGDGSEERLRAIDPLISAVGATVSFWVWLTERPVELIHDDAKVLTQARIAAIQDSLMHPERVTPSRQGLGRELAGVRLVDSKTDPRVQVADLLAGIGRVVGEAMVKENNHPLGLGLLPMISEATLWPIRANQDVREARKVMQNMMR